MDRDDYDRFEEYVRDGWCPHRDVKSYRCGWCGQVVSASLGLSKGKESFTTDGYSGSPFSGGHKTTDVRICPQCWIATTFLDKGERFPEPLLGDNFDASNRDDGIKTIVSLYNEARIALSWGASSCAVLMFRKLLMHVAFAQGAKKGLRFVEYVDHLKNEGIVGKPQHAILDRIRKDGNQENHQIVRASPNQAGDLLDLVTLLIRSIFFTD